MNKKNIIPAFLFFVFFFFLPVYLVLHGPKPNFGLLFCFYLLNFIIFLGILRSSFLKINKLKLQAGSEEEKINVQNDRNSREIRNQSALNNKILRYASLKKIIEDLNSSLTCESISEQLTQIAFSLIANSRGICILYLVDNQSNSLQLYKTRKKDKSVVIKAKQGDIFDYWVLRHASPLLIEDLSKDFRFDREKVKADDFREFSSLISSPLISGNHFLGVLRLDDVKLEAYLQEDLRFLTAVCDLGAVALENGLLYQNTQELAIHDGLTGLFTKGHFRELLQVEIKSSIRHERPVSLVMLDIDFFKNYNDKFGHIAGDIVLKALSETVEGVIKKELGIVCRFGGEEFCAVFPGKNKNAAMEVAESLRLCIEKMIIVLRRQKTTITVSIGVSSFPNDAVDETELIMKADKSMYAAKLSGRNCVVGAR